MKLEQNPELPTGTVFSFYPFYQFDYIFAFNYDQIMSKLMIT